MGLPSFGFGYLGDGEVLSFSKVLDSSSFVLEGVVALWDPGGPRNTFMEHLVCAWCCKVSEDEVPGLAF